jgi:nucleoside-diphosphate-sugar epimerase
MKVIVSRSCGFVGSTLINTLLEMHPALQIVGFDNFIRPGSYLNREPLQRRGNQLFYADLRNANNVLRQIFVGLPARSLFAVPSSTAQRYFSGRFASEEELLHEW